MSTVSAAHVSSTLRKAGHERADEASAAEISGFVVSITPAGWHPSDRVVTVSYQDYDHSLSNAEQQAMSRVAEAALDAYAATLRKAGYAIEDWVRYDGVRLGLFVMGRA